MNTKILKIAIFFIIIVCLLSINNITRATDSVIFSVISNRGKSGDEVIIDINLDTVANFASANFVLEYDTTKLEYVTYYKGEILETATMCVVKNNSDTGKVAIGYVANPTDPNQTKQPGNILKVVFKIISDDTEITNLNLSCTELKDDPGTDIVNTINQGKIEIIKNGNLQEKDKITNKTDSNEDNSLSDITIFPKAGFTNKVWVIEIILIFFLIVSYRKYKNLQGIK